MKKWMILLTVLSVLLAMISCQKKATVTNLNDLRGRTIGVQKGTIMGEEVSAALPTAKIKQYLDLDEALADLQLGSIDAMAEDVPVLLNIARVTPGLKVLDKLVTEDKYALATAMNRPDLKRVMDKVIDDLKRDGTFDAMLKRWFSAEGAHGSMPEIRLSDKNGVLKFGTSADSEPFSFLDKNSNPIGFEIELAHYIARELGMGLEVRTMPFTTLIPNVIAHKVDIIGACITITEFRSEHVLFSTSHYTGGIGLLVRK